MWTTENCGQNNYRDINVDSTFNAESLEPGNSNELSYEFATTEKSFQTVALRYRSQVNVIFMVKIVTGKHSYRPMSAQ